MLGRGVLHAPSSSVRAAQAIPPAAAATATAIAAATPATAAAAAAAAVVFAAAAAARPRVTSSDSRARGRCVARPRTGRAPVRLAQGGRVPAAGSSAAAA